MWVLLNTKKSIILKYTKICLLVVALILLQIQTGRVNDRKANKMKKLLI